MIISAIILRILSKVPALSDSKLEAAWMREKLEFSSPSFLRSCAALDLLLVFLES